MPQSRRSTMRIKRGPCSRLVRKPRLERKPPSRTNIPVLRKVGFRRTTCFPPLFLDASISIFNTQCSLKGSEGAIGLEYTHPHVYSSLPVVRILFSHPFLQSRSGGLSYIECARKVEILSWKSKAGFEWMQKDKQEMSPSSCYPFTAFLTLPPSQRQSLEYIASS